MTSKDIQTAMGKPNLLRLQEVATGIKVDKVMGSRVLIRTVKPYTDMDRVEKSGMLFIPETVKEQNTPQPSTGLVVQVGPKVVMEYPDLQPGVFVMFSKFAGSDVFVNQEEFRILEASEIMCTLSPSDPELPDAA